MRLAFRWRPALTDPDDDMVLETAINGQADMIITFNEGDFTQASRLFGCLIIRPGEFLRILAQEGEI